jgi:hypothetical protein
VQPERHHLGSTAPAFLVEHVEAVLEELEVLLAIVEPRGSDEAHVVGGERVGNDELAAALVRKPIGQIVVIGVGDVVEAADVGDKIHGLQTRAAGVPSGWTLAGGQRVQADGLEDLPALLIGGHVLVLDPFVAMRGDLPACLLHGGQLLWRTHQGGGDAVDGHGDLAFGEVAPKTPEAGARAIFVHRLDIGMALAGPWGGAEYIDEKRLGCRVAMQDVVFAAFLVVEHDLDRDICAAGPFRIGRGAAVAEHVAGIAHRKPPESGTFMRGRNWRDKRRKSGPFGKNIAPHPLECDRIFSIVGRT